MGWSLQLPATPQHTIPVPLKPRELIPELRPRASCPNSGSGFDVRRRTGEWAKSGDASPTTRRWDRPTSASRRCSAGSERHLWATRGRCAQLWESGSPLGFLPTQGTRGAREVLETAPVIEILPYIPLLPGTVPTLNRVFHLTPPTHKYLLSTYYCIQGFGDTEGTEQVKPPCLSRAYHRRGRQKRKGTTTYEIIAG